MLECCVKVFFKNFIEVRMVESASDINQDCQGCTLQDTSTYLSFLA